MKQIKQFRYCGSTSEDNYPEYPSYYGKLINGNIFDDNGYITHLGIQAKPGTKFYLNNSRFPITVGFTGIYELQLENYGRIYAIKFDEESINEYEKADNTDRLLIDIIYEGGK